MDGIDYKICRTQQRIYEYAAKHGYDMEQFSNFFLSSDFCSRAFDVLYSRFQLETPVECMDFIMEEAGDKLKENAVKKQMNGKLILQDLLECFIECCISLLHIPVRNCAKKFLIAR